MLHTLGRAAAVTGAVLLAAACTQSAQSDPEPAQPVPAATIADLQISDAPIWTSDELKIHPVRRVALSGDIAVLVSEGTSRITAVDLTTGKQAWTLENGADLGDGAQLWTGEVLVRDGLVLAQYFRTACEESLCAPGDVPLTDEQGYAALDVLTGETTWLAPAVPAVPTDSPEADELAPVNLASATATDETLVMTVNVPGAADHEDASIGVDLGSGQQQWRTEDFAAYQAAGSVIYGLSYAESDTGAVAALAPESGAVSWQLPPRDARVLYAGIGADGALFIEDVAGPELEPVTADGELLDSPGTALWNCPLAPTRGRLACVVGGIDTTPRLLTLGEDGADLSVKPAPESSTVSYVDDAYIYVSTRADDGRRSAYAADEHGNKVSRDIPGEVVASSDDYLAILKYAPGGTDATVVAYSRD